MEFHSVNPSALDRCLQDPSALVLDIRPHAAFSAARLPRALSLSVPSTLLKRPLFSLARISAMLSSPSARTRFDAWPTASLILVYDADSTSVPESSNIAGLLRKFRSEGFQGPLLWLKGGFHAVSRDCPRLIDSDPLTDDPDNDDDDNSPLDPAKPSVLRPRHLPTAAFSLSSTTVHNSPHFNSPHPRLPTSLPYFPHNPPAALTHPAFNPFFDTIRQNTELSHGITERIPLRLPRRVRRRIHDLPFPWLQDIARRAANAPHQPRTLSDTTSSSDSDADSDDSPNPVDVEQGKEALAMQFFKIELSEQRRLMGIMEHHSRESGHVSEHPSRPLAPISFPYSITAGVEKGAKNRYRHIWPFEHARVRLHQKREADDDYVNASYIQPLGTNKRYIATQGPLPATFTDFWTLCWEQNVHVIVMLTREVEGAMVKCGTYWTDTVFGPLRLRLISKEGYSPSEEQAATAGFFDQSAVRSTAAMRSPRKHYPHSAGSRMRHRHRHYHNKQSETIKRTFELTHTGYPEAKPRKIIHFQYLEWPDLNVPDDPRGVLGLVKQVEEAVNETRDDDDDQPSDAKKRKRGAGSISLNEVDEKTGIAKHALGKNSPVLLHCSAGVGRTGGFIAVDAILDAIRRELRSKNVAGTSSSNGDDAMDVDSRKQSGAVDVTSFATVPLTMASGSKGTNTSHTGRAQTTSSKLVVHVPVAASMRVDQQLDSSGSDNSSPGNVSKTMQWARNVREETGINGAHSHSPQLNSQGENLPPNSPVSASTPESSSMGASSTDTALFSRGGNYSNSSSSVGTSVSGKSSAPKANFPSSSMVSELRQAVLQSQQTAIEHRLRTISAPSMNIRLPIARGRPPHLANSSGSVGDVPSEPRSDSIQDREGAPYGASELQPSSLFFDFSDASPFKSKLPPNPRGLSSEAEVPSRSQTPSVEDNSQQSRSVPPWGSAPDDILSKECKNKTFDYKEPRPLHEDFTPPPLTTFEDPIWEVVQDMREQRMSLCQSLRQYVFVHAAIIEGALMIVDEEKDIAEGLRPRTESSTVEANWDNSQPTSISPTKQGQSAQAYDSAPIASVSSLSLGKGGNSPTELSIEDKGKDALLSKRPSIKRKQRSGDDLIEDGRYHPMPTRIPPNIIHGSAHASAAVLPP